MCLHIFAIVLALYAPNLPTVAVVAKLDSLYLLLKELGYGSGWSFVRFRLFTMCTFIIEAARVYAMFMVLLLYWLEMQLNCIDYLGDEKIASCMC